MYRIDLSTVNIVIYYDGYCKRAESIWRFVGLCYVFIAMQELLVGDYPAKYGWLVTLRIFGKQCCFFIKMAVTHNLRSEYVSIFLLISINITQLIIIDMYGVLWIFIKLN